jgi:hypothetical protein
MNNAYMSAMNNAYMNHTSQKFSLDGVQRANQVGNPINWPPGFCRSRFKYSSTQPYDCKRVC